MSKNTIELLDKDLDDQDGVYCYGRLAGMKIWDGHPNVSLNVAATGEARCPHCSTVYRLKAGGVVGHQH